ncbi:DASH complex subunit DAD3 [Sphaerulina musiva]
MDDFRPTSSTAHHHPHPEELLSPLEQEVLDEYAKLVGNLDDLAAVLNDLAAKPSAEILDSLRGLERKTTTVFTLLKASVYSIVLQQEIADGDADAEGGM